MGIIINGSNVVKKYFGTTEIQKCYLGTQLFYSSGVAIPLANIISEWKMEGNALDTVGVNNGNAINISYTGGLVGQTAVFSLTTSRIIVPNPSNLSFTNNINDIPFSFTALVYAAAPLTFNRIIKKSNSSNSLIDYMCTIDSGALRFFIIENTFGTGYIVFETPYTFTNVWKHICFAFNGLDFLIYIDGVSVPVSKTVVGTYTSMKTNSLDLVIGNNYINSQTTFKGKLDCLRFWDKELSVSEALQLSTDELAGIDINP